MGDVYLNNGKEEEAYETYQKVLKEEPGYAPALLSMASYYEKKGQDSLYQVQLDTILLNDNVDSDTKMNIMRQLILRSEQTNKGQYENSRPVYFYIEGKTRECRYRYVGGPISSDEKDG